MTVDSRNLSFPNGGGGDGASPVRRDHAESLVLVCGLVAVLWLANHRYEGIWHDAIIYSLIAARQLHPEGFGRELFFVFGSQGDFSLYTSFFSWVVSVFGLDMASRIVVLSGGGLWCGAFVALGRVFFGASPAMYFLALFGASLGFAYSPNLDTFVVNENFATARILAMPIALLGLAVDLAGRRAVGVGLMVLAAGLHPLLGIWAIGVAVSRHFPRWCLLMVVPVAVLGAFAIAGMTDYPLLTLMDEPWAEVVSHSSHEVFLAAWPGLQVKRASFWLIALVVGAYLGGKRFRRFYGTLAVLFAAAYALSALCSYFLPLIWVMQVQPWRVMWLAVCFGCIALTDVAWRLWRSGTGGRLQVLSVTIAAWAFPWCSPLALLAGLFASVTGVNARVAARLVSTRRFVPAHGYLALALIALLLLPGYVVDLQAWGAGGGSDSIALQTLLGFFVAGGGGLGVLLLTLGVTHRVARRVLLAMLVPALLVAWNTWDRRTKITQTLEEAYLSSSSPAHFLSPYIVPGDVVAWPRHEMEVWFSLNTANYASSEQASGLVFSQEKTVEAKRRMERLAIASMLGEMGVLADVPEQALAQFRARLVSSGQDVLNLHALAVSRITFLGARYLCADPLLDWVVAEAPDDNGEAPPGMVLRFPGTGRERGLYHCRDLR
jgi:hypothetical protein